SHYSSSEVRWKALRAAGAVGTISIANPKNMEIPWNRQEASRGRPRVSLADPALSGNRGMKFSASWNPAQADNLLAGSGHPFQEILDAADHQQPLPHFALHSSLKASLAVSRKPIESKNVIGLRP